MAGMLAAGASCQLSISSVPAAVGAISGSVVLTDDALNVSTPSYATQTIHLSGTGTQATPTLTWLNPGVIDFGTNLSGVLNATAKSGSNAVPGTFAYAATATGEQPFR
jgi:hypothetical protein